jgi:hypothetical protein
VAIEVQLARAAPGELAARQERYRAAGVRGAWLVPADRCPPPCRGLPAFPLEVAPGSARVGLRVGASSAPGLTLPLDAFVAGLLLGRVRFEEARVVRPLGCPVAVTAPDACRRCGRPFEHVAGVTNIPAAPRPGRATGSAATPCRSRRSATSGTPTAGGRGRWRARSGACAARSPGSPRSPRAAARSGETYLTALCPACGAAQGDGAVDRLLTGVHPRAPVRVPLPPAPLTYRPLDGGRRGPHGRLARAGDPGPLAAGAGRRGGGAGAGHRPGPVAPRGAGGHLRPA